MRRAWRTSGWSILILIILLFNNSCSAPDRPTPAVTKLATQSTITSLSTPFTGQTTEPTGTPKPPRQLTICLASEPQSLFPYGDDSLAARSVRAAIYDGPIDLVDFKPSPVILESLPSLANNGARLEGIQVNLADRIVDSYGNLTSLQEGISYFPTGCQETTCAQQYTGRKPVQMDQLVVHFKLRQGLQWSDGTALTADDSVYAFEVARSLYPTVQAELLDHTDLYQTIDQQTVEWRGTPGYRNPAYATAFFAPFPRHTWGNTPANQLTTTEISSRKPIGYGPYQIDEWISSDVIRLSRNARYFRAGEGLPSFDLLVYRIVPDSTAALRALQAGECDYLDESYGLESRASELLKMQAEGVIQLGINRGLAWEQLVFGLASLPDLKLKSPLPLFQSKEVRQAIAQCIDREQLIQSLFQGYSQAPDSYVPPSHPLAATQVRKYPYDPHAGATQLETMGWLDKDGDPRTPRQSQGVPDVPDGTTFTFSLLVDQSQMRQKAASFIKESLAQCGVQANIQSLSPEELYAPGPEGPLFGRHFSAALLAWTVTAEASCGLFLSSDIPGVYPEYSMSWGGANASGFSDPEFDRACLKARTTLPDEPAYQAAQIQAQGIFSEQLPVLPLYLHWQMIATRPDLCGIKNSVWNNSSLWNIEVLDYGNACKSQ